MFLDRIPLHFHDQFAKQRNTQKQSFSTRALDPVRIAPTAANFRPLNRNRPPPMGADPSQVSKEFAAADAFHDLGICDAIALGGPCFKQGM